MGDLLGQLEQLRADGGSRAAAPSSAVSETVEGLKQVVAELKNTQRTTDRQHQDSLEAVHGTIEDVVGRLASIESDLRQPAGAVERREARTSEAGTVFPPMGRAPGEAAAPAKAPSAAQAEPARPSTSSSSSGPAAGGPVRRPDVPL